MREDTGMEGNAKQSVGEASITNPGKVLFANAGITKGDVAGYYRRVSSLMMPLCEGQDCEHSPLPQGR